MSATRPSPATPLQPGRSGFLPSMRIGLAASTRNVERAREAVPGLIQTVSTACSGRSHDLQSRSLPEQHLPGQIVNAPSNLGKAHSESVGLTILWRRAGRVRMKRRIGRPASAGRRHPRAGLRQALRPAPGAPDPRCDQRPTAFQTATCDPPPITLLLPVGQAESFPGKSIVVVAARRNANRAFDNRSVHAEKSTHLHSCTDRSARLHSSLDQEVYQEMRRRR
ncbi:hypothetical protein ACVWZZ_001101 [Bradyrhizobium sp. LM6.10]